MNDRNYTKKEIRDLVTKAWEEGKNAQRLAIQKGFWAETGYDEKDMAELIKERTEIAEMLNIPLELPTARDLQIDCHIAGNWAGHYEAENADNFLIENNLF